MILIHTSGHMLVANSAAIRRAGVTAATADPVGGAIIRKPGSREPEGLFQETAMHPFIPQVQAPRPREQDLDLIKRAVEHYAANGYTTAAEGLVISDAARHDDRDRGLRVVRNVRRGPQAVDGGKPVGEPGAQVGERGHATPVNLR